MIWTLSGLELCQSVWTLFVDEIPTTNVSSSRWRRLEKSHSDSVLRPWRAVALNSDQLSICSPVPHIKKNTHFPHLLKMAEIKEWFMSMPPITRGWFGLSVAFPLIGRLGILNAYHLILTTDFITKLHVWFWPFTIYSFLIQFCFYSQLWRPITATFFYPLTPGTGFHYLINLYFLYNYSKNLEANEFTGRPADYLFMLIFNWAALVASTPS